MTPRGNLSRFMQQFVTSYTVYSNTRHRRTGPCLPAGSRRRSSKGTNICSNSCVISISGDKGR